MTIHNDDSPKHKVVISGMSGRFPMADNIVEFQENLLNKIDSTSTDHGRWEFDTPKVPQCMGNCNNIEKFDRVFFGVHSRLTAIMDPVSRLLLEHSFEAIMDAGLNPKSLRGANIAVFTATNLSESEKTVFHHKVQQDGFGIMGSSKAMIPNRISFFFGLNGPSVNLDSGCTGTATALERAYHAIKEGHCDGAIVAGAILCLHPHISYQLRALGLLSPDGKTRCFDDSADGHTRSDGIAVLFLQRASDAKRIYQEVINVRAISTDCDEINTIMYPKPSFQINLMKELLQESGLLPDDISYLEASGVGIKKSDAEELEAIDAVFRNRKAPLPVGSVKSYIGDATPANAVNSIIKMVIASETGQIPPTLHFEKPNSSAQCLKTGRIQIPTDLIPWVGPYSAVNTTSANGTFSNILLKAPNIEKKNNGIPEDDLPRLIIASGRTEESVREILNYSESRPVDAELLQMLYDIFESEIDAHLYRGYTIVPAKGLPDLDSKKQEVLFNSGENREIWWIFSGMGSQWSGMGEHLLRLPVFEAAIRKCDAVLKPLGFDIYRIITEKDPKMFDQIINSFVGIAAIQIGLVDVLRSVGLEPDYIIGHSVGELGCAYADGCFTAEQMIMSALSRGLASTETKLQQGSMAAVGLGYEDVKPLCPSDIDIACHNGPESSTISGPSESMTKFVEQLTAKGIFAKEVACSNIAYHSRYIAPAGPKLLERLQKVIPNPNPRSSKWVSSSVPRGEWNTLKARLSSAEYHTNNLLSPVLFEETSRLIPPNAICVEIAPHGLLQAILKRSLPESCVNIPLTKRGHPDNLEVLLSALGKLYNVGLQPQVSNLYPKIQYPVGKGTPSIASLVKWDHSVDWLVNYYTPIEEVKEGERIFEIDLNKDESKYLKGNIINGKISIPLSLCLVQTWEILKTFDSETVSDIIFEEIKVQETLIDVPDDNIIRMMVMLTKGTGKFEVIASEVLIVCGTIRATKTPGQERLDIFKSNDSQVKYELEKENFYTEMEMRGFHYSGDFQVVQKASLEGTGAILKWDDNWVTFIDGALQFCTFKNDARRVEIPIMIRKIIIDHTQHENAVRDSNGVPIVMDKKINYLSAGGMEIQGIKLAAVPRVLEQNRFSTDTMNIVHNSDRSCLSLSESLRFILQIILENTFSNKIQKIQMIGDDDSGIIQNISGAMRNIPEACLFRIENIIHDDATFNKALTVITSDLTNYNLQEISQKLGQHKFLLAFINASQEESVLKLTESNGLKAVFKRKHMNDSMVLFRKKVSVDSYHVINNSKNIVEIVKEVKSAELSGKKRVYVVLQKDKINISIFLETLEKSANLEKIRIYIIESGNVARVSFAEKLFKDQMELDLFINVLTGQNLWATLRRVNVIQNPRSCSRWSAERQYSHDPSSITWTEGPAIDGSANIVKVEYSCLNDQDILIANGIFYSDSNELIGKNRLEEKTVGIEFAGIDSNGNRVMGVNCGGSLSNFVSSDPGWTWLVPKSWSLEDAATVPLSYLLAYTALVAKAEIQAGERVMLSDPCKGFGLAALYLAIQKKCDVFVAYETEEEKKLIQSIAPKLPSNRYFKSSGETFRDEVLYSTDGQGVDVVICNQCEIKRLELFFTMTKRNARVVLVSDLSHNKIHESVGMEIFLREISLYSVVPKRILLSDSETKKSLANMLKNGIESGVVKPLARKVYNRASLSQAFQACLKRQHLGKIVIKTQAGDKKSETLAIPRFHCTKSQSYIIIDGLNNFGLELTDWLITRGARHVIIASTKRRSNGFTNLRFRLWKSYGADVHLHEDVDLSLEKNIKALLTEASSIAPVDAIFDLRRVDGSATESSNSLDSTTLAADKEARLTCPKLRLFVVCSAIENLGSSKLLGKLGHITIPHDQKVQEVLTKRKRDGLHALMIRWGINNSLKQDESTFDVSPAVAKYIQKLDEILGTDETVVDVSYLIPNSNEIEPDTIELEATSLDPAQRDLISFTESLYEQYGVHVEGFSYLQV